MGKRLFVQNLSETIDEGQLLAVLSEHGKVVSAEVDRDPSGVSRGTAVVEMETEEDAERALQAVHDSEVEGKKLDVKVAAPEKYKPPKVDPIDEW